VTFFEDQPKRYAKYHIPPNSPVREAGARWRKFFHDLPVAQQQERIEKLNAGRRRYLAALRERQAAFIAAEIPEVAAALAQVKVDRAKRNCGGKRPGAGWRGPAYGHAFKNRRKYDKWERRHERAAKVVAYEVFKAERAVKLVAQAKAKVNKLTLALAEARSDLAALSTSASQLKSEAELARQWAKTLR
jgi:hypothetical protein